MNGVSSKPGAVHPAESSQYSTCRPTRLDKIEKLRSEVPRGVVAAERGANHGLLMSGRRPGLVTAGILLAVAGAFAITACSGNEPRSPEPPTTTQTAATATPQPTATPQATATTQATAAPQATAPAVSSAGTWSGLEVAPENRCAPYDADDYPYSQSVEQLIVGDMGGIIYGPYTGTWFASTSETDIEHIVARSEAHDSGLCAADAATRRRFASDTLNLTLASPSVNRSQKSGKDAAEWLPDLNRCWFASRVVEVRLKYALTVDERERDAIEGILSGCSSTAMIVDTSGQAATATPVPAAGAEGGALELYDDNGNGRITCAEARRHGIAPVSRGHPAYPHMDDRDGDGVVCE